MKVISVPTGSNGCDSDTILTASSSSQLLKAGFNFVVRYVSRTTPQHTGDILPHEMSAILDAGLGLMLVQHCNRAGWSPTTALGMAYGQAASENARYLNYLPGGSVWLDLEGVLSGTSSEDIIAFINNWYVQVASAGFLPGIYIGFDEFLTSDQLYHRLFMQSYWRSMSTVPDVSNRGYCMFQTREISPIPGLFVDRDVVMSDKFGGLPVMMKAD